MFGVGGRRQGLAPTPNTLPVTNLIILFLYVVVGAKWPWWNKQLPNKILSYVKTYLTETRKDPGHNVGGGTYYFISVARLNQP